MTFDLKHVETPSQQEVIAGSRFAIWKHTIPQSPPRLSLRFYAVTFVICLAILGGARYAYFATLQGNDLPSKVFAGLLLAGTYGGILVAAFVKRRGRPMQIKPLAPQTPSFVPAAAIPTLVRLRAGDTGLGRSFGWLWVENGFLCFRGEAFDFRLRREDFKARRGRGINPGQPVFLNTPKKVPVTAISFVSAFPVGEGMYVDPDLWKRMEADLALFEQSQCSGEPLFPPVRMGFQPLDPRQVFKTLAGAGVAAGSLVCLVPLFVPLPRIGFPLLPGVLTVCLFLSLAGVMVLSSLLSRSREKELDKLKV